MLDSGRGRRLYFRFLFQHTLELIKSARHRCLEHLQVPWQAQSQRADAPGALLRRRPVLVVRHVDRRHDAGQ